MSYFRVTHILYIISEISHCNVRSVWNILHLYGAVCTPKNNVSTDSHSMTLFVIAWMS